MAIPASYYSYFWNTLVLPRLGSAIHQPDAYAWGGSFSATDINQGTDCLAEGTLVTTSRGDVPIEQLTTQDRVLTRQGYRRVMRAWKVRDDAPMVELTIAGRTLRGTSDHRVWTENRGWVGLGSVRGTDTLVLCQGWRKSSSRGIPIAVTPTLIDQSFAPISNVSPKMVSVPHPCTGQSGNITMVRSHQGTRSITTTTTRSTTTRRILSVSQSPNIVGKVRPVGGCMTTFAPSAGLSFRQCVLRLVCAGSAASVVSTITATVYDVSVEGTHEFFANGVLVHNCSGAVSAELSALQNGPDMIYGRQFWTGSFAGINPGDVGPFFGCNDTEGLVCIAHPTDAPSDYAMIIAIIQTGPDPAFAADAHMICRVGGIDIEMGGNSDNYHDSQTDPTCASVMDTDEFNQWFYLPGPLSNDIPDLTVPPYPGLVASQFM